MGLKYSPTVFDFRKKHFYTWCTGLTVHALLTVYITSQYFFSAIIYRDIISHITITYRYIMYFFRTFKKSTAPYKVHNIGLRYINVIKGGGRAPHTLTSQFYPHD